MTDSRRSTSEISCRSCGFSLGRLAGDRRHAAVTPGVHMLVNVTSERFVALVCPRCGTRRTMTDLVVAAMAIPRIKGEAC